MGFEQICLELILAPLKLLYPEWVIADLVVFWQLTGSDKVGIWNAP